MADVPRGRRMAGAVLFPEPSLVDRHSSWPAILRGPAGIFPLHPEPLAAAASIAVLQAKPTKLQT